MTRYDLLCSLAATWTSEWGTPPTGHDIAEKELREFLGDDLWNMEWMR